MSETLTHDKTPDQHSSVVGGSSAARVMACPGSVDLLAKIPDSVKNTSSKYADEGTGLHEVMAYLVAEDVDQTMLSADTKIDELFTQYKLDDDRFFDAVIPAYRQFNVYLDSLYNEAEKAGFADPEITISVEQRVAMPGIDGAFGTADIVIRTPVRSVIWDWKFGAGKLVQAGYKVADGDGFMSLGNDQLMFYGAATRGTHPHMFGENDDWPVTLIICQPRIGEGDPSKFQVRVSDLENFRLDLIDAVEEALSGAGLLARPAQGAYDYCYFSPCKSICPLHLNGAEAAAEIGGKLRALRDTALTQKHVTEAELEIILPGSDGVQTMSYGQALALLLDLKASLEPVLNGVASDAQTFMEAGGDVPGWKLVPKKAGWDSWEDEKEVDKFLGRRKLAPEERRVVKAVSPAVARKLLKAKGDEKGVSLLEKYVRKGVSSGHTMAPADDIRPAIETTSAAIGSLAKKIASL